MCGSMDVVLSHQIKYVCLHEAVQEYTIFQNLILR